MIKPHLKAKPVKKLLVEGEGIYAEEHQISLKTNKGSHHMNLWLKASPDFDSDDALDKFLNDAQGLLMMFDAPKMYTFQDLPKFLIYTLQMYIPNFGDKPNISYQVFGKQSTEEKRQAKLKTLKPWRNTLRATPAYIDVSNSQEKSFADDVLLVLLRAITK